MGRLKKPVLVNLPPDLVVEARSKGLRDRKPSLSVLMPLGETVS